MSGFQFDADGTEDKRIKALVLDLSGSAAALGADAIPSTDVSDYAEILLQITGTFAATLTFQGSNDNATWVSLNAVTVSSITAASVTTATTAGAFSIPIKTTYFRLRATAYTSGTATATGSATSLTSVSLAQVRTAAVQSGVWNITNVTGTVTLPTGAATAANQSTEIASLASIDTKVSTSALQTTGNASLASIDTKVSTSALQTTGNASLSSIDTKLTNAATTTLQTAGNASLSSIDTKLTNNATTTLQTAGNASLASMDTKLPTPGQKPMATSQPVVLASDQSSIPVGDILNASGVHGALTVGLTAVAVRVGGANLAARKALTAYNTGSTVHWGYTSAVTIATGTPLEKSQFAAWSAGPATTIFMIAATAGNIVRVTEGA